MVPRPQTSDRVRCVLEDNFEVCITVDKASYGRPPLPLPAVPLGRGGQPLRVPPSVPTSPSGLSVVESEAESKFPSELPNHGEPMPSPKSAVSPCHQADKEEEAIHMARELIKSVFANLLVIGTVAAIIVILPDLAADFVPVDCDALTVEERSDRRVCESCSTRPGVLPLMGEWERSWPRWVQTVLYFIGLIWSFMGVQLVCDQFMAAIEEITSAERVVWLEVHAGARRKFHVKVWNSTMANLSLMALGSSAPEILLACVEMGSNGFFAGRLGPSTIVGSAAFNLLVITAVCVCAIPAPEIRKIEGTCVFWVTTSISILAYVWLIVVLFLNSRDIVEKSEAFLTLLGFPFLLIVSFAADKGCFQKVASLCSRKKEDTGEHEKELEIAERIQARFGKELPEAALHLMVESELNIERTATISRAKRRADMNRSWSAGRVEKQGSLLSLDSMMSAQASRGKLWNNRHTIFGFKDERYVVLECAGTLTVKVVASREPGVQVDLRYFTREGTAKQGLRYRHIEGIITFGPKTREVSIHVSIIDNDTWDPDEEFYLCLDDNVNLPGMEAEAQQAKKQGRRSTKWASRNSVATTKVRASRRLSTSSCASPMQAWQFGQQSTTITVLNDDMPGILSFDADEVQTTEGSVATIGVCRTGGSSGRISCRYETVDDDAVAKKDYEPVSGELVFEDGEICKTLQVPILISPDHEFEDEESFKLVLSNPSAGVKFDPNSDGGERQAICDIIILADKPPSWIKMLLRRLVNTDRTRVGCTQYAEQVLAAFFCNGSPEDQHEATAVDWFFHWLTFIWKLIFAIVPPPIFLGGWACFFVSLMMIGLVTALVGELAALLGCSIGMADEVTAITLVALGTSLPDTFASKAAAQQDETADNSIGNVMGSNSVNVFLGLGISWTVGALYWDAEGPSQVWLDHRYDGVSYKEMFIDTGRYPAGGMMMPSGTLLFSVGVYSLCACLCVVLLVSRRRTWGGELGGPALAQYRDSAVLFLLWMVYVVSSTAYASSTKTL